jgi:two-component system chemotaxis response regulator CheB
MKKVSVLVVDDSSFMRKMISIMLGDDSELEVVATARNGLDAIAKVKEYSPQVITMDIEMPEMDGLTALRHIMKEHPTPTIMISAATQTGADITLKALESGAIDFVHKPSGSISPDIYTMKAILQEKVKIAAQSKVSPYVRANIPVRNPKLAETIRHPQLLKPFAQSIDRLVAIGTSTGGPRALQEVIRRLPKQWNTPIVIVQHMPAGFTLSLANRLNSLTHLRVVEATHEQAVEAGTVYIAPGGLHMEVVRKGSNNYYIALHDQEPRGGHKPSVDVLFESISELTELNRTLVVMTGMGGDGAQGMKKVKDKSNNVTTIAEAESSCIVYGMPRSAIALGCVDYVVPLESIADQLNQVVTS